MGTTGSLPTSRGDALHGRAERLRRHRPPNLYSVPGGGAGMSGKQDVTYTVDFRVGQPSIQQVATSDAISRIARLMALAIRFEGLVNDGTVRDYADLARRGHVTRARMPQIMKLLHLAPDIQEQILFLPPVGGLNERNLRRIVSTIDWREQRSMFQELIERVVD